MRSTYQATMNAQLRNYRPGMLTFGVYLAILILVILSGLSG